ncbi:MAG: hypothetical protein ACOZQL_15565 [Myxococcota bacterium]
MPPPAGSSPGTPAEFVISRLSPLLGPEAARSTVSTFCKRTVGVQPEKLTREQMLLLLPSFESLLSVLVGAVRAGTTISSIRKEL